MPNAQNTAITEESKTSLRLLFASVGVAVVIAGTGAVALWRLDAMEDAQSLQFEAIKDLTLAIRDDKRNLDRLAVSIDRLGDRMDGWQESNEKMMPRAEFFIWSIAARAVYPDLPPFARH
jgi:uncharacterized coiled-coil protein SlyX